MHTVRDNFSLGCAGLVAGTTSGTFKIANILHYAIAGRTYAKAVTDNIAFALKTETPALAIPAAGASQTVVLFLWINAAGTVVYSPSALKTSVTGAGYQAGAIEWPQGDSDYALIGAIKVATNASGAFTAATTSLGASNQTVTYYNVGPDLGVAIPF